MKEVCWTYGIPLRQTFYELLETQKENRGQKAQKAYLK